MLLLNINDKNNNTKYMMSSVCNHTNTYEVECLFPQ